MADKQWSYGVMTCAERRDTLLPRTLASLAQAGFDQPRLFVDAVNSDDVSLDWENQFRLPLSNRWPRLRSYGNWLLGLVELVVREPVADYYAIFQDDFVTYKNLRGYLEHCLYPTSFGRGHTPGYWNLFTMTENEQHVPLLNGQKRLGWHLSNQRGRGAVALVFNSLIAYKLLNSSHTYDRLRDPKRGCQAIDGGVVTALGHQGVREYIHYPSLVYHTGQQSSMIEHHPAHPEVQPQAGTFLGEDYDALDFYGRSHLQA